MSLDASNHKEHKYILLYIVKGWGYESVFFLDIRSLMKWGGKGGMPLWGSQVSVTGSVLS